MSLESDKKDFLDYLEKSKKEPEPKPNSKVWADDPYSRKSVPSRKKRKKILKKKKQ